MRSSRLAASRLAIGRLAIGVLAAVSAAAPAWAQLGPEPYSYRSGGNVGMSTAYRQAYLDQQLTGNRPRALLRGADGTLLTVTERDQQAFVSTSQSNYLVNRGGDVAAGVGFAVAGVRIAPSPIDGWVAQLDGLQALK